jgi:hypothetical protein
MLGGPTIDLRADDQYGLGSAHPSAVVAAEVLIRAVPASAEQEKSYRASFAPHEDGCPVFAEFENGWIDRGFD